MHSDPTLRAHVCRRAFLGRSGLSLGSMALGSLLGRNLLSAAEPAAGPSLRWRGILHPLHYRPKAKRVIWLYMAGGPSHLETLDYKPELARRDRQPMPAKAPPGAATTGGLGRKRNGFRRRANDRRCEGRASHKGCRRSS